MCHTDQSSGPAYVFIDKLCRETDLCKSFLLLVTVANPTTSCVKLSSSLYRLALQSSFTLQTEQRAKQ